MIIYPKWIKEIYYVDYINKCMKNIENGMEAQVKFKAGVMNYGFLHIDLNNVDVNNISILQRNIEPKSSTKIIDCLLDDNLLRISFKYFMIDNKNGRLYYGDYNIEELQLFLYQLFKNIKSIFCLLARKIHWLEASMISLRMMLT